MIAPNKNKNKRLLLLLARKDLVVSLDYFFLLYITFNPLSANSTKWSNTLKQFVGNLPTNCLSVFDHFVGLALKGLKKNKVLLRIIVKNVILRSLSIACNITDFNNLYKQYQIVHPNNSLRKVM